MIDDGRAAVESRVPRGTLEKLELYVGLLRDENEHQNLVSRATLAEVWHRHVLDSLQLEDLAGPGCWADIGSGAGLPGLIVAIASDRVVTLIEPRRRRADFLLHAVERLGLGRRVEVRAERAEMVRIGTQAVISARAVAPLGELFAMAGAMATGDTLWVLPKGRSAADEVAAVRQTWQGDFRLVPSLTEPEAAIVVARDVRRRGAP